MTAFPELQEALVGAAHRRHGRTPRAWRLARPVLAVAACAAVVAGVVALTGGPNDERAVSPGAGGERYAVLARPATEADALPDVAALEAYFPNPGDFSAFDPGAARLAAEHGPRRLFLAAGTVAGAPAICSFVYTGDDVRSAGCTERAADVSAGYDDWPGSAPGIFTAVVRDGIDAVTVRFVDGATEVLPVRSNAVLTAPDREPVSVSWVGADGETQSEDLGGWTSYAPLDP